MMGMLTRCRRKWNDNRPPEFIETLSGIYKKWTNAGQLGCVEQIQLIDEVTFVGLYREYACKP